MFPMSVRCCDTASLIEGANMPRYLLHMLIGIFFGLSSCAAGGAPSRNVLYDYADAKTPDRKLKQEEVQGVASWYGDRFHGRRTANGESFDMHKLTAAHKTFPFNTIVRVVREDTRQNVIVRINDRGPFSKGRVIDLSKAAAEEIELIHTGTAAVEIEVLQWGDGKTYPR